MLLSIISLGVFNPLVAAVHRGVLGKEQETVIICHTAGGNSVTMEIPTNALDGHLHHGDTLGACSGNSSSSTQSSESSSPSPPAASPPSEQDHAPAEHGKGPQEGGTFATFRGSGLAELAAATHATLARYGLHSESPYKYTFHHEMIRPETFASQEAAIDWTLREHAACCSMYRYLVRLRAERPYIKPGYIDWLTGQLAGALGEDPTEIRAALLGHPHDHPHTSGVVRSLTGEGCGEQPYPSVPTSVAQGGHRSLHAEHILSDPLAELLAVEQKEIPGEIAFAIMSGATVFREYGVSHTKEMHLLVVRNDLRHFQHIHPERDAEGTWHVPFIPLAGGTYWIYADFIGTNDQAHMIRFEKLVEGDKGETGLSKNLGMEKLVGKYIVNLQAQSYPSGMLFTVRVLDKRYRDAPHLEEYLGALGHGILIAPNGEFIHTHPSPAGDALVFHTPALKGSFYRIFAQFQIRGEVMTAEFDWKP